MFALFHWTPRVRRKRIIGMSTTNIAERDGHGRSAPVGRQCSDGRLRPSRAAHLSQLVVLATGAYFCSGLGLWAQTSESQSGDAIKYWTATTESQGDQVYPTRTVESHTQSGNRTVDKQSVQRRDSDGHFEPYQDIEKETVQVDATTVRTTTRTFGRNLDGSSKLLQVTEEEKQILPGGDSNLVRTTSKPDGRGNLQPVRRQIEETKKSGKDVEETKTTVMLPSVSGDLAPVTKVQEVRKQGANDTVESQKTTLFPDGAGNWQVGEIRQVTTTPEGKNHSTTEQRVSRADSEGKLNQVSRTVSKESESAPGEKRDTVETHSVYVPGSAGDGSLHLVERAPTVQHTSPIGQQTTEQQVEKPDPGDPG